MGVRDERALRGLSSDAPEISKHHTNGTKREVKHTNEYISFRSALCYHKLFNLVSYLEEVPI